MTLGPLAQAYVDALPPGVDDWARKQAAKAPAFTPDRARRLAILLALRPADTGVTSGTPKNGVATPNNVATPRDQESATGDAFPQFHADFHDPQDEHPTGLAGLLAHHGADTPERGGQ